MDSLNPYVAAEDADEFLFLYPTEVSGVFVEMPMSTAAVQTTAAPNTSNSVPPALGMGNGYQFLNNAECDPNNLSKEERMKQSMDFWKENAERHKPREAEHLERLHAKDKAERALLHQRYLADQRQKESSKKENSGSNTGSTNNQGTGSGRGSRKRSNEVSADAAREEYRIGFAGMGASVTSRPVNRNNDQAQWAALQHQQQQQLFHQSMLNQQKMQHRQGLPQHLQLGNGMAGGLPSMNMMSDGMLGQNGMIQNAVNGGSPHPPAPYPLQQMPQQQSHTASYSLQPMQQQQHSPMTHNQVQMLDNSSSNVDCSLFPLTSNGSGTPLPSDPAPFHTIASPVQPVRGSADNGSAVNSFISNQALSDLDINTPSAIDVGGQVDDNALDIFAHEAANTPLQDLGTEDLFPLDDPEEHTDVNDVSGSVVQMQQQNSVPSVHSAQNSIHQGESESVGHSVLSPPFQQPLGSTGPLSVHSVHSQNPMSNGNCNPPLTPNSNSVMTPTGNASVSVAGQMQRLPTPTQIGVPLSTSTPIIPSTSAGPSQQSSLHPQHQLLMSQSNGMMPLSSHVGQGMMQVSSMPNSNSSAQAMQQHQFASQHHLLMQQGGYAPSYPSEMAMMSNGHQMIPQGSMMQMNHMGMQMMPNGMHPQQYSNLQRNAAAQQMYQRVGMNAMNSPQQQYLMQQQQRQRMGHPHMSQHRYPQGMMDPQAARHQQQLMSMQMNGGMGNSTSFTPYPGSTGVPQQPPMYPQFNMN